VRTVKGVCKTWFPIALATVSLLSAHSAAAQEAAKGGEKVTPISAPTTPLPEESSSKGVTRFSFIAYGDTRRRRDGVAIHEFPPRSKPERMKIEECKPSLQCLFRLVADSRTGTALRPRRTPL